MRRFLLTLIVFLLLCPFASATWTDKYVTATAAGGGDGAIATPWTLAEAIANVTAGYRINIQAGTYTNTTTSLTFATAGTTIAPIWWRGYNASIGDLDSLSSHHNFGILSGTYTSGATITGSAAQTCGFTITSQLNGINSTGTVALTATNTIAGGTAFAVAAAGNGFYTPAIAAILSNGTATCSGTAVVTSALTEPYITFTTGQFIVSGAYQIFSNLSVTSAANAAGGTFTVTGGQCNVIRCRLANTVAHANGNAFRITSSAWARVIGCYLTSTASADVARDEIAGLRIEQCYISGGLDGVYESAGRLQVSNSFITGAAADGIHSTQETLASGNTIVSNGGDGIEITSAAVSCYLAHNLIANNTGIGINQSSGGNTSQISTWDNVFYTNGGGNITGLQEQADYNSDLQVALMAQQETASPFKAVGTDYALQYNALAMGNRQTWMFENNTAQSALSRGALQPPADGWKVIASNSHALDLFAVLGVLTICGTVVFWRMGK